MSLMRGRQTKNRPNMWIVWLMALALVAAACGDDGDETTTDDGDVTTEESTDAADEDGEESGDAEAEDDAAESGEDAAADDDATDGEEAAAGCDPLPTKVDGTLTVATGEPVFEPWMVDDDPTNGEGYESALVYALAAELGIDTIEWVRTGFEEAISAAEKDYDFNIQQYSITAERDEVVDFSNGYYQVEQAIIGAEDSAAVEAASVADLASLQLGAAAGTTSLNYIDDVIQPESPGAPYDDNATAKAAFDAGQVDALVFDLPTAYYITAVEIPEASIIGVLPRSGEPEELGMLFEEASPLVACVNEALAALDANGTLADLEETWLNDGGNIPTLGE